MQINPFLTSKSEDSRNGSVVSIIGGGATSVAFLHSYLQLIERGNELPRRLYVFEARDRFGPGAAYEADLSSNLLNTKTGFITPFYDRPGDFYRWLAANEPDWRPRHGSLDLNEHSYAPRRLFGEYLESQLVRLLQEAAELGVTVVQINAEVNDVFASEHRYVVATDFQSIECDYVFFLCGGFSGTLQCDEPESARILGTPYPVWSLGKTIPKTASVGIIGARLSCIDAVIGLIEQGHLGPITIHSRSGHFPSVRGTQGRIVPKVLNSDHLASLAKTGRKLNLSELVGLVQQEIALQGGCIAEAEFHWPPPPQDLVAFLRDEIYKAGSARIWQAVLYSTNAIIDRLWALLDEKAQSEFIDLYLSVFTAYRVSIPIDNARKILSYLESGALEFRSGKFDVRFEGKVYPTVRMHDQRHPDTSYDYLINATGSSRAINATNSTLVNNLLRRGIMSPHRMGGVSVDNDSYCLKSSDGNINPHIRAVGELTVGAFFFTSALDINARHARACVVQFAKQFQNSELAVAA